MVLPCVEVLMSTYNGERHLQRQVESILEQTGVRAVLTVRDDGSSDATTELLEVYGRDERVTYLGSGPELGLPRTYFHLLQGADPSADYWALADQDDVWLPDKLHRAVRLLATVSGPALVCGRVLVTDEDLRVLYPHPLPTRGPSFANALVQNIATGCTILLNRAALGVLRDRWPATAVMHDAWLYLVISALGTVLYDDEPSVLYRQHGMNSVGMGRGPLTRTLGRVRRQLTPGGVGAHGRQNAQLRRTHQDLLPQPARDQLEHFLSSRGGWAARLDYALTGAARRQTLGSDLVMRCLGFLNRL